MIKEEYVLTRADGIEIHRHYSDEEKYIIQVETGIKYEVAEDTCPCRYTYIESNEYLPSYIEKVNNEIDEKYSDSVIEKSINNATIDATYSYVEPTIAPTTIEVEFEEIDSNEVN